MTTDSGDPEARAAALAFICARAESITGDAQLLVDELDPAITWSAVSTADTKALMATLDEVVDLGTQFSDQLRSLKIRLRGIRDKQAVNDQRGNRNGC